jgi:SAM-dependent methyltransferase
MHPQTPATTALSDLPSSVEQTAHSLGATFRRDPQGVSNNLHADWARIQEYLGTYLPRTVFEFQTIMGELLGFEAVRKTLPNSRPLRVLDLGSGTGGAWFGLVSALQQAGYSGEIAVQSADGNAGALGVQNKFAKAIAMETGMPISLTTTHIVMGDTQAKFSRTLAKLLVELGGSFDFILVSKHLSELYGTGGANARGIVAESLKQLGDVMSDCGYLVVLDVTTKVAGTNGYFPVQMAREIAQFVTADMSAVKPVLPIPCGKFMASGCDGLRSCFTQTALKFYHQPTVTIPLRQATTKVTYRVLARTAQADQIVASFLQANTYSVNASTPGEVCKMGSIVANPNPSPKPNPFGGFVLG